MYRSSFLNPLTYVRLIGHIFGHAGWSHFINNIMMILILGPMLEEKYGSKDILLVILITAVVTGAFHMIFSPFTRLLGASGVVFAFILLSSLTSFDDGGIPVTFILVAVIYIGEQIYQLIAITSNVPISHTSSAVRWVPHLDLSAISLCIRISKVYHYEDYIHLSQRIPCGVR